jgi:replicative DNA helicase
MEAVGDGAATVDTYLDKILCDDRAPLTVADVVATCRRMVSQGAKAVLVDHLGEIKLERSERHDLDLAEALQQLRNLAKTARVPILVFSHLRRREGLNTDSEPRLTDFAFSSGIERMARVALGLWRGDKALNCTVLKQTQGMSGVTVALNMNLSAGVVIDTPASEAARNLYERGSE